MKLLVIGCNGQLGTDMMRSFPTAGHTVIGVDVPDIDITNAAQTRKIVTQHHPDIIINPAAYTAVDAAEKNADLAFKVNADGAANVADAAREVDAALFHISTDYVFDGAKQSPYIETDTPNPLSVYGKSKLAGEQRIREIWPKHFIFRIAWLYGAQGANFVKTILKIALQSKQSGKSLKIVDDQKGSPTHTVDVCNQILAMIGNSAYGLYHSTSEGSCTWFEFTKYFLKKYAVDVDVLPCTTQEFPRPAPRPANSVLENQALKALGKNSMPGWATAFDAFFDANQNLQF